MRYVHMNPQDAFHAHLDLHAHRSLAIHYRTFQLTDEDRDAPEHELMQAMKSSSKLVNPFFTVSVRALYSGLACCSVLIKHKAMMERLASPTFITTGLNAYSCHGLTKLSPNSSKKPSEDGFLFGCFRV